MGLALAAPRGRNERNTEEHLFAILSTVGRVERIRIIEMSDVQHYGAAESLRMYGFKGDPAVISRRCSRPAAGTRIIGGGRVSNTTLTPSMLVNPPRDAKVSTLEIFGPLTCAYSYADLDEAIAAANSLPVAFQSSIFTRDVQNALDAAERLDASAVLINDHTAFRTDWMPFAGWKASGHGIGGIPFTIHEMTAHKMIVFKS